MRQQLTRAMAATMGGGAVLLLACAVLPLLLLDGSGAPVDWVQDGAWALLSVLALVLAVLMPFLILIIYGCQIEEAGVLGLIGLVLSLIGLAAFQGFQFDMAFVWPVLAARAPELLDYSGPLFRDARFGAVHVWMGPVHSIGILLLGIALFRARVLGRAPSLALTIGLILSPTPLFPPLLIRAIGGLAAAPALGWVALFLWRRAEQTA